MAATTPEFNNGRIDAPPRDGDSIRLELYVWNAPAPHRDGAFDTEILLHEYAHLLSIRTVGQGVGLSDLEAQGLGEGWSDFMTLAALSESSDPVDGVFGYGAYSTYLWVRDVNTNTHNYYFGQRRFPYSTNLAKSPLTYKDIDIEQYALQRIN